MAHKVISKKPNFHLNLDITLKQWYVNQLYDCNSMAIAKTLLMEMPHVLFTHFRNELARVLGTHQHSAAKSTGKSVSTSSVEVESEEEGRVFKSHKNSVPNPLRSWIFIQKLDSAIAENLGIAQTSYSPNGIYQCTTGCTVWCWYKGGDNSRQGKSF